MNLRVGKQRPLILSLECHRSVRDRVQSTWHGQRRPNGGAQESSRAADRGRRPHVHLTRNFPAQANGEVRTSQHRQVSGRSIFQNFCGGETVAPLAAIGAPPSGQEVTPTFCVVRCLHFSWFASEANSSQWSALGGRRSWVRGSLFRAIFLFEFFFFVRFFWILALRNVCCDYLPWVLFVLAPQLRRWIFGLPFKSIRSAMSLPVNGGAILGRHSLNWSSDSAQWKLFKVSSLIASHLMWEHVEWNGQCSVHSSGRKRIMWR